MKMLNLNEALPSNKYCQHSGVKLMTPSVIEQITTIIDQGGPWEIIYLSKYDRIAIQRKGYSVSSYFNHTDEAENECERLNSDYIAKAILQCLKDQPLDFKSVYDKQLWIDTIEGMIK